MTEIFSCYGTFSSKRKIILILITSGMIIWFVSGAVVNIDLQVANKQYLSWLSRGSCYVDYEKPEQAEEAIKFMNGGMSSLLTLHFVFVLYTEHSLLSPRSS